MLFKNLLSVVSLIAVGGITKTLAAEPVNPNGMTACGTAGVTDFTGVTPCTIGDASTYCINTDGIIYGYSSTASTCAIKTPGVYAFTNNGDNNGSTSVELNSAVSITADQLLIYRCSYGHENKISCSRAYGYVQLLKNTDPYIYTLKSDKTVVEEALSTITGGGVECKIDTNLGSITKNKKLCLKVDSSTPLESSAIDDATITTPNYYIMANGNQNIFTGESDNKNIVIEARQYAIVYDTDAYDYCVDTTNNSLKTTFKEFCDNDPEDCNVKAEHEAGVWKRTDDSSNVPITITPTSGTNASDATGGSCVGCTQYGYYLIDSSTTTGTAAPVKMSASENGVLFKCSDATNCTKESKVGYFKNGAVNDMYIKCTAPNTCSNISVTEKTDCTNGVSNGGIIKITSELTNTDVLCLDNTKTNGIPITADNNDKEFFAPSGSIFFTGDAKEYVKVTVKTNNDQSVVLSAKASASASTPSTYIYTDGNCKIYKRNDTSKGNDVCAATKVIMEFKYKEDSTESDIYEKRVEHTWPSN